MEMSTSKFKSDTPFRYMESELRMCKTSNAVDHPGHILSRTLTLTLLHLILPRKAAHGMPRPRLLRHTLVGVKVEVGVDRTVIQTLATRRIDRTMHIRQPFLQDSYLNASSIPTKSQKTTTPKPLAEDLLLEVAALVIERANLIKIPAADHLDLDPLLTTMAPRIGVGKVISITSTGPRPDLTVVMEIKARAPTLTTHNFLLHIHHQQVVRPRLAHLTMGTLSDLRIGTNRDQTSGLNHHRRMNLRRLCRLQAVTYRPPQTKAQNSVLL